MSDGFLRRNTTDEDKMVDAEVVVSGGLTLYRLRGGQSTNPATATSVSSSGNNTIKTPASGKAVRLFYVSLSADDSNSASVTVVVKFANSSDMYKVSLPAGATWARNIGAGKFYVQGAVDEALVANLSVAQTVHVSIESLDV